MLGAGVVSASLGLGDGVVCVDGAILWFAGSVVNGATLGIGDGGAVGATLGIGDGGAVGVTLGIGDGGAVGATLGIGDGGAVGATLGIVDGGAVGVTLGTGDGGLVDDGVVCIIGGEVPCVTGVALERRYFEELMQLSNLIDCSGESSSLIEHLLSVKAATVKTEPTDV
jgi:hypothetical protein